MIKDYATALKALSDRAGETIPSGAFASLMDAAIHLDGQSSSEREGDKVRIYQNADGEWYWRRVASNSKSVAIGGEGYVNKSYTVTMARACCPDLPAEAFEVVHYNGLAAVGEQVEGATTLDTGKTPSTTDTEE